MKPQGGFTLIELMIVVAIIAILAAIALPMYLNYVSKSQVAAALAIIRPGKTTIEVAYNENNFALVDANYVGLQADSRCTTVTASLLNDGTGSISCLLAGSPAVHGQTLTLNRASNGTWTCDASAFDAKHRPYGCN